MGNMFANNRRGGGKTCIYLLPVLFAVAALPSLADNYTYWNGSSDSNWNTPANWEKGVPDEITFAQFGYPYETPYTITVDGIAKVFGFYVSGSRTADLTFTGTGSFETYRNSDIVLPNGGPCHLTFDVSVTNASSSAQTILGNNTFKKDLYIGSGYDFNIGNSGGNPGTVLLEDNANLTALGLSIYADSSLTMTGSSALNLMGDSTLKVYKNKSALSISDNAVLNGKYMKVYDGASATISDNAQVNLTRDLTVFPGGSLAVAGNPTINLRKLTLPFSPESGVSDEWTMNGGTFCATNSNDYRLELPYTNAVKTLSGTGTFHMCRFYISNASNLTVRLNGPDAYLRQFSGGIGNSLSIGNGSTFGLWGSDLNFGDNSTRITVEGQAALDTTDYQDGVTGRNLTLYYLNENSSGVLTVKGRGTCTFAKSHMHPNLGITGKDDSSIVFSSYPYALGDIVLHDNSKMSSPTFYFGHKGESDKVAKSLTMDGTSSLVVGRYAIFTGDVTLSGNANAVIQNKNGNDPDPILTCDTLALSDGASLSVTGTIAATSLAMSGDAHLAFKAGTAFTAGAAFGDGDWAMEITIPSGYEAGIHPVVIGAGFEGDFADHVTLLGETTGWSARTLDGNLILYKDAPASGIEWIGKSSASDDWSDSANWNGGNVPTVDDIVAFGGLDRPTPYNDSVGTVSGIVFRASAGSFTLSGADALTLTASSGGRSSTTVENASIVSHSAFDQTIESFVNFADGHCGVIADGGGALNLTGGFYAPNKWRCFVVGGDVRVNGDCSIGYFSFKTSTTGRPSCLTVLPGCKFTIRNQYFRGLVESTSYIGRLVVEDGGEMIVKDGDCVFWHGELENVIDGTLSIKDEEGSGRLVGGPSEQYYVGKGAIYADSARSGRTADAANHYINFGGTLKLYMNGNWWTATYSVDGSNVMQDPNYPTRFRMTDGTTLGATADWTYGPADDAYDVIANALTPAGRTSIMVGTVTVDTQNPKDETMSHTITFVDPLDASAANVVKVGAGTLAFNEPAGFQSQISNLTVNAGVVQFTGAAPTVGGITANAGTVRFSDAPTLAGALTIASTDANFCVDGVADTMTWGLLATAAEIVGPNGETMWKSATGMRRFKIVAEGTGKSLYGAKASGFTVVVR